MCECLTYDDGEMHLCLVCADAWREEERLRALFTPERLVKPDADSITQFEPYYMIPAVMVDREEGAIPRRCPHRARGTVQSREVLGGGRVKAQISALLREKIDRAAVTSPPAVHLSLEQACDILAILEAAKMTAKERTTRGTDRFPLLRKSLNAAGEDV